MEQQPNNSNNPEQVAERIKEGLKKITNLSQLESRGEPVTEELDKLVDEIGKLVDSSLIKTALEQGIINEYGDIDPGRVERIDTPAYERRDFIR